MTKKLKLILSAAILFSITISAVVSNKYFELSRQLEIFNEIFRNINTYYVDNIEPKKMMDKAINSMLYDLDPYTSYFNESDVEDFMYRTEGEYGGIGNDMQIINDKIYIVDVYRGSPSDKAGIKVGNMIKEINGEDIKGKNPEEVRTLVKGSPGTKIELKIFDGEKDKKISLKRESIKLNSVEHYELLEGNIGYIYLESFSVKTSSQVSEAFEDLKRKGMKKLILDLRNNPGGLLDQAVNVCNFFIDKNVEIVKTKGKLDKWNKTYKTKNDPKDVSIPMVVLVNDNSASASEIVSGSIQDLDRGVIVGQRTFGKGLVQQIMDLSYGTQLKLTTAKYYIPSGRCIQEINYFSDSSDIDLKKEFKTQKGRFVYEGKGIKPDIEVEEKGLSHVSEELLSKNEIFFFVNDFCLKNNIKTENIDNFRLGDEVYNNFIKFIDSKNFEFKTSSEEGLEQLVKIADKEEYKNFSRKLIKLGEDLKEEKKEDMMKHKEEILYLISQEMVKRYYYKDGLIKYNIKSSNQIKEAILVLKDKKRYDKILNLK